VGSPLISPHLAANCHLSAISRYNSSQCLHTGARLLKAGAISLLWSHLAVCRS
jgi:hypothetical protein